jgi:hypothetical protein
MMEKPRPCLSHHLIAARIVHSPDESMKVSSDRSRIIAVGPSAQQREIADSRIGTERVSSSPLRTSVCEPSHATSSTLKPAEDGLLIIGSRLVIRADGGPAVEAGTDAVDA